MNNSDPNVNPSNQLQVSSEPHSDEAPSAEADERKQPGFQMTLLLAVLALTAPAAYYHGIVLQRWGDPIEMQAHVDALESIPEQIGYWRHHGDGKPIAEHLQRQLQIRGYTHRIYQHEVTGQRVTMLLLVGPSGPLVRHPPEICYQTRANRLLSSRPLRLEEPNSEDDSMTRLRLLAYESNSSIDGDFYVAYAFGNDGRWDVPSSPRLTYGGEPVLYKLHVLTDMSSEAGESPDGLRDFLTQLLPVLTDSTIVDTSDATAN